MSNERTDESIIAARQVVRMRMGVSPNFSQSTSVL